MPLDIRPTFPIQPDPYSASLWRDCYLWYYDTAHAMA
jgi:hypothetical protein